MFRFTLIFSFLALCLTGCGEKTAAEKAEEARQVLREQKRVAAIAMYERLIKDFPDSDKAVDAKARVAALKAQAPK